MQEPTSIEVASFPGHGNITIFKWPSGAIEIVQSRDYPDDDSNVLIPEYLIESVIAALRSAADSGLST